METLQSKPSITGARLSPARKVGFSPQVSVVEITITEATDAHSTRDSGVLVAGPGTPTNDSAAASAPTRPQGPDGSTRHLNAIESLNGPSCSLKTTVAANGSIDLSPDTASPEPHDTQLDQTDNRILAPSIQKHNGNLDKHHDGDADGSSSRDEFQQGQQNARVYVYNTAEEIERELAEDDSSLQDRTPVAAHRQDSSLAPPDLLAIRGQGFSQDDRMDGELAASPPPSLVTDRGERSYANLRSQDRTNSLPLDEDRLEMCFSNRLFYAMVGRDKMFMPRDQLETYVNVDTVQAELAHLPPTWRYHKSIQSCAEEICRDLPAQAAQIGGSAPVRLYRKIFALLVLLDKQDDIFKFLDEEVSDVDLPLQRHFLSRGSNLFDLRRKKDATRPLACFRDWHFMKLREFYKNQWSMLAPFFAKDKKNGVQNYSLLTEDILPFTYDSRLEPESSNSKVQATGGFGRVFKVHIHPNHHDFHDQGGRGFAIKELYSKDPNDWKSEVDILKRLSRKPHDHLISLLVTYEQSGSKFLMFHWADADLLRYWSDENKNPCMDAGTVRWAARQCKGIACGLAKIHVTRRPSKLDLDQTDERLYGRHGDIKPRNILWFRDVEGEEGRGRLKITDFGIAEMHSKHSRSKLPNRFVKYSPSYCPPECYLPGEYISRSFDIWTLGCLYLEFLTWLIGGWHLVETFQSMRMTRDAEHPDTLMDTFYEIVECGGAKGLGARVKPEVTTFITYLHSHQDCTDFIHDFLDLIEEEMIIVESDRKRRSTSEQVRDTLTNLEKSCNESNAYATSPAALDATRRKRRMERGSEVVEADIPEKWAELLRNNALRVHPGKPVKRTTF